MMHHFYIKIYKIEFGVPAFQEGVWSSMEFHQFFREKIEKFLNPHQVEVTSDLPTLPGHQFIRQLAVGKSMDHAWSTKKKILGIYLNSSQLVR